MNVKIFALTAVDHYKQQLLIKDCLQQNLVKDFNEGETLSYKLLNFIVF